MTIPVSTWYVSLGNFTFPTMFMQLRKDEIDALLEGHRNCKASRELIKKMDYVVEHLPGTCFVHADVCAPSDSQLFHDGDGRISSGHAAWNMLRDSEKVRSALRSGESSRLGFHPFRRMDHAREFRLFIREGALVGASQRFLDKHHPRLGRRHAEIWSLCREFADKISDFLPSSDITVDVYMTATAKMMILDMNPWGEPTDPLLYRDWDRDWSRKPELLILPKPMHISGNISVSF